VRFEVLTVASMKMTVFWVVVPCTLEQVSEVSVASIIRAFIAASTSETSVNFYQTTRCNNPEVIFNRNTIIHQSTITNMVMVWNFEVVSKKFNMDKAKFNFIF
jgi:hypothetical protein